MAAYAALNSVMFILQQIHNHPRPPITLERQHTDSLCEIISFLQDFLEKHSHHRDIGDGKEALESRIADAAYAAEDVIESHIVDQILAKSNFHEQNNFITLFDKRVKKMITTLAFSRSHRTDQILTGDVERNSNSLFCQDFLDAIKRMDLIEKIISTSANIIGSSIVPPPRRKYTNTKVLYDAGFDDITKWLTAHPIDLQLLTIFGMRGIGKTTLARNVYGNPYIVKHFHIRLWVTISQEYKLRDILRILLEALSCPQNDKNKSEGELRGQLYKTLFRTRYLIVLDDVWSIEALKQLMSVFPSNDKGSRVMITTRFSKVFNHFAFRDFACRLFELNFLDERKSWYLLREIVFPLSQFCRPELEGIGYQIARNCKGLPLSIAVIGGLLAKSEMRLQHWEYMAETLNSIVNLKGEMHCLNILFLSYYHLPIHLKPCFLYAGLFPEDSIISVPRLKKLWVDKGFLKTIAAKSLEEVAEEYLKDLIDRKLILVHELGSIGEVKYCKIHDLLRYLCLSLREALKDSFLQDFLENHPYGGWWNLWMPRARLESQIVDAAEDIFQSHIVDQILAKEDIIQSHIVDQILAKEKSSNNLFYQNLQKVVEEMNLIKKEAIQIQEKNRGINDDQLPRNIISTSANNIIGSSTVPPPTRKHYTNTMVGFDDVLNEIMDRLNSSGGPRNRQILPIVGMGGIGKTTLARNVYDLKYTSKYFDVCIWVTVSQEYRLRDILLEALSRGQNHENKSEDELGLELYQTLFGRRYLVILDDVWSIEAWEKLMLLFPDENNGSRIMITTRLSNVCNHFGSCAFKMNFLDEDNGWKLFCQSAFPQDQCCPWELEETGKKIARNCKGLPLSIVVIGGLLANSEKTLERWEYVEKNLNSIVNLEDEQHCLKILFLSYNDLPVHLKPCFLHLGVFLEDTQIVVSSLIRLWVAEGFLKPIATKSLEVVAEEYLKDLIDRNLILGVRLGSSGKIKYCKIHDLLRDLCVREAKKDKFFCISEVHDFGSLEGIQSQRRFSVHQGSSMEKHHTDKDLQSVTSASLARSLIWDLEDVYLFSHTFRLVRVFKTVGKNKKCDFDSVLRFVNSRYLDFQPIRKTNYVPYSIRLLWNLQTLIIKEHFIYVPPQIWEMSQLRHLDIGYISLPDPPNVSLIHEGDDDFILRDLHTSDNREGQSHDYCLNNLHLLNKLESLSLSWNSDSRKSSFRIEILPNFAFPHSLKKLILSGTHLLWEDMRMIGSLPHLQVLKLDFNSFRGPEWYPVEGEFLCLKFLLIQWCRDLVYWDADRTHFPCLEHLVLRCLDNLEEIPLDIGHIPTIRSIELWNCSNSAGMSAKNILDEQVELGNDDLQVRVDGNSQFSSRS